VRQRSLFCPRLPQTKTRSRATPRAGFLQTGRVGAGAQTGKVPGRSATDKAHHNGADCAKAGDGARSPPAPLPLLPRSPPRLAPHHYPRCLALAQMWALWEEHQKSGRMMAVQTLMPSLDKALGGGIPAGGISEARCPAALPCGAPLCCCFCPWHEPRHSAQSRGTQPPPATGTAPSPSCAACRCSTPAGGPSRSRQNSDCHFLLHRRLPARR
jgi:hypothetical protein